VDKRNGNGFVLSLFWNFSFAPLVLQSCIFSVVLSLFME